MARDAGQPDHIETEPSPLVELLRVALPAVVTMTSYTVMQFVDTLVVSRLGEVEVAAAGNGGIAAFVPASIMFGMLGVINTFVSQNLGAGRPERGSAYAWNGMWMSLGVWLLVLLPYAALMPQVFGAMRGVLGLEVDARTAGLELVYGRILVIGMIFTIMARGISHFFYGLHRPRIVMISALIANVVNIPVTIVLVFGLFGLPAMGLAGAAVGTVIGSFVEACIPVALFLSPRYDRLYGTRGAWRPSREHVRDIWRIGWPAGAMFGNEIVCWWIFMSGLIAHFGVAHNTAGWIALRYMHVSFMPAVGLSIAVTAVVGRQIGRGRRDLVARRTGLGLAITMGYMGACALAFVLFREPMVRVFTGGTEPALQAEVIRIGSQLLILAAAFQIFDAMAITMSGALRGAGDTVWPGVATMLCSWTLIIGGGKLMIELAPGLESLGPWIGAALFIIVLALALAWRFHSGAWRRIELVDRAPGGVLKCCNCGAVLQGMDLDGACPACGTPIDESMALAASKGMPADAGEGVLAAAPGADVPLGDGEG